MPVPVLATGLGCLVLAGCTLGGPTPQASPPTASDVKDQALEDIQASPRRGGIDAYLHNSDEVLSFDVVNNGWQVARLLTSVTADDPQPISITPSPGERVTAIAVCGVADALFTLTVDGKEMAKGPCALGITTYTLPLKTDAAPLKVDVAVTPSTPYEVAFYSGRDPSS